MQEEVINEEVTTTPETIIDEAIESNEVEQQAGEVDTEQETEVVEPEYTPSYTYKVRDEEYTMDDWAKGLIKDPETEQHIRDLYTEKHGLDLAKKERAEVQEKYNALEGSIQKLNEFVVNNDARGFIDSLGLPKQMFMDYAINELQYMEMTPEQRAQVDQKRNQELQATQLERDYNSLQEQSSQQAIQMRDLQLDNTLQQPQYAEAAKTYDARVGRPGAFKDFVVQRGEYNLQVNNVELTMDQAIQEAMTYGGVVGTQAPSTTENVGTHAAQRQEQKPVIPKVGGGNASPAKKQMTSIEDLRKHRERLQQG